MNTSLDRDTDVTAVFDSPCDTTAPSTDVVWKDADLPAGTRGTTSCRIFNSAGHCDRNDVTLDPAEINIGSNDEEDTTKTACHEAGHTVGLMHGSGGGDGRADDCMVSGESTRVTYSSHHRGHVNAYF